MTDGITLLGVKGGPAIRGRGAMPTASLLRMGGRTIVVDCGIGVSRGVAEAGVSLLDIEAVFITHLHSDHVLELGPLLYTAWTTGLTRPVRVFGPDGIAACWEAFLASMAFDHDIRVADEGRPPIRGLVEVATFGEGDVARVGEVEVSALRVDHPPVTECYALKFAQGGRTVVFSADTCHFPPLADFARGADVLVHEAMLLPGVENIVRRTPGAGRLREHLMASHASAEDAGRIATEAGVGTLALNHLIPADDPAFGEADWIEAVRRTWTGRLVVGRDGLFVPLD